MPKYKDQRVINFLDKLILNRVERLDSIEISMVVALKAHRTIDHLVVDRERLDTEIRLLRGIVYDLKHNRDMFPDLEE